MKPYPTHPLPVLRLLLWLLRGLGPLLAGLAIFVALPAIAQPKDPSISLTTGNWAIVAISVFLALTLTLHIMIGRLGRRFLLPFLQATIQPTDETPTRRWLHANSIFQVLLITVRSGLWVGVGLLLTQFFPITQQWSNRITRALVASFTTPVLSLGNSRYSLGDIILLAGMLLGLVVLSKIITDLFKIRILTLAGINRGAQEAIAIIVRYTLLVIGTIVLLQIWGLDISSLAILASALSVGIGFGLQDIAKNVGSGLVLVFERPIQVGDFVEVGKSLGTIERIGVRSTVIRTPDQISIIMPNSRFLEDEVINWSHDNPVSRLHLPVGVAYSSHVETVRTTLLEAAQNHPYILIHPKPQVLFKGFGDSSLDFELLVWTRDPSQQIFLKSDLYFRIERLFRDRTIEIPFPQQDLHIRSGTLPVTLPTEFAAALQKIATHHASSPVPASSQPSKNSTTAPPNPNPDATPDGSDPNPGHSA